MPFKYRINSGIDQISSLDTTKRREIQTDLTPLLKIVLSTLPIADCKVSTTQHIDQRLLVVADKVVDVGEVSDESDQLENQKQLLRCEPIQVVKNHQNRTIDCPE